MAIRYADIAMKRATMRRARLDASRANGVLSEAGEAHPNWWADDAPGWSAYRYPQSELSYESLTGVERQHLIKVLTKLVRTNGFAKAITTLVTGFALGGRVSFHAENKRVQAVLDRFWDSELNAWEVKLFRRVKEWRLYGEQVWPVFVNPYDGFVRVGYISPASVKTVTAHPDFPEELQSLTLYSHDGISAGRKYQIISPVPLPETDEDTDYEGEVFFLRANALSVDPRGYSDLLTMADFFAAIEDLVFTSAERSAQQLNWTKHVKVGGHSEVSASLEERLRRTFSTVKPGSVAVTSNDVDVSDIVPNLAAAETAEEARTLVNVIAGSSNIPAAWLGFGEQTNRATLDRISGPTMKMLDSIRRELSFELRSICRYVILQAQQHGVIGRTANTEIEVELPQIAEEDSREWGRAIAQVTTAATLAHKNELVTIQTASDMVRRVVENIGVTYNPEHEIEMRREEPPIEREEIQPRKGSDETNEEGSDKTNMEPEKARDTQ